MFVVKVLSLLFFSMFAFANKARMCVESYKTLNYSSKNEFDLILQDLQTAFGKIEITREHSDGLIFENAKLLLADIPRKIANLKNNYSRENSKNEQLIRSLREDLQMCYLSLAACKLEVYSELKKMNSSIENAKYSLLALSQIKETLSVLKGQGGNKVEHLEVAKLIEKIDSQIDSVSSYVKSLNDTLGVEVADIYIKLPEAMQDLLITFFEDYSSDLSVSKYLGRVNDYNYIKDFFPKYKTRVGQQLVSLLAKQPKPEELNAFFKAEFNGRKDNKMSLDEAKIAISHIFSNEISFIKSAEKEVLLHFMDYNGQIIALPSWAGGGEHPDYYQSNSDKYRNFKLQAKASKVNDKLNSFYFILKNTGIRYSFEEYFEVDILFAHLERELDSFLSKNTNQREYISSVPEFIRNSKRVFKSEMRRMVPYRTQFGQTSEF